MKTLPTFAQIFCSAFVIALTSFLYVIFSHAADVIRISAKGFLGVTLPPETLIVLQVDEVIGRLWPLLLLALVAYTLWIRARPVRMFVGHAIVSVVLIAAMLFTLLAYEKLIAASSARAWEYRYAKIRMNIDDPK